MTIDALKGRIPSRPAPTAATDDAAAAPAPAGFGDALGELVERGRSDRRRGQHARSAACSTDGDVHDAMIALQRAELTLQLTVQIRNKLVQAYQDIMRMPV